MAEAPDKEAKIGVEGGRLAELLRPLFDAFAQDSPTDFVQSHIGHPGEGGFGYAQNAAAQRGKSNDNAMQEGKKNLGVLVYRVGGGKAKSKKFVGTAGNHAEFKMKAFLQSIGFDDDCSIHVVQVFTERYPCGQCDGYLKSLLKARHPAFTVYWIAEQGTGDPGRLIADYKSLGLYPWP